MQDHDQALPRGVAMGRMDAHFTPSFTDPGSNHSPWEDEESGADAYQVASEHLNTFDQPHFAGVHKAEGGPFAGDYDHFPHFKYLDY